MTVNMKKLLELASENQELVAKVGGKAGEGEKNCVCIIGGDGNW